MRSEVVGVEPKGGSFVVSIRRPDGKTEGVEADIVINAAGLYSDKVAKMLDPSFPHVLAPLRGEYFKFNKARRPNINMNGLNVYPAPEYVTANGRTVEVVGVHLTPTFGVTPDGGAGIGNIVTVGPEFTPVTDREDYDKNRRPASLFYEKAKRFFPNITLADLEPDLTGIMANMGTGMDWLIEKCPTHPNGVQLVGLDSPALTSSLAIARHVADIL
jgi:glycerol-3-phosphate dehydrogenase